MQLSEERRSAYRHFNAAGMPVPPMRGETCTIDPDEEFMLNSQNLPDEALEFKQILYQAGIPLAEATCRVLLKICRQRERLFGVFQGQQWEAPNDLNVCVEVPRQAIMFAMAHADLPSDNIQAFRGGEQGPALTLYEICAVLGTSSQLQALQTAAQRRMSRMINGGTATMPDIMQLMRAGADPLRQHLALAGHRHLKRSRTCEAPLQSGTMLHWLCEVVAQSTAQLKPSNGKSAPANVKSYAEVTCWVCETAPLALLLTNSREETPLTVLMKGMPVLEPDLEATITDICGACAQLGHTAKSCPNQRPAGDSAFVESSIMQFLRALAFGFTAAVDKYPWRAAALLGHGKARGTSASTFRADVETAKRILAMTDTDSEAEVASNKAAIESLDRLLLLDKESAAPASVVVNPFAPRALHEPAPGHETDISAMSERKPAYMNWMLAERLGSLAAVRARSKVLQAIAGCETHEAEALNAVEVRARLEASEAARREETAALEKRADGLEAELSGAQRQLEEAEARWKAALTAADAAQQAKEEAARKADSGGPAVAGAKGAALGAGLLGDSSAGPANDSPEAFVAALRRERLVDLEGLEGTPPEVRAGIAHLSKSLCAAVERLAEDLYESDCHFVHELIQNAEDAFRRPRPLLPDGRADPMPATLRLRLGAFSGAHGHAEYFVAESNEAGFTKADVAAICDISASSKKKEQRGQGAAGTIGCKGIGFKSVFTVSDRPHVLSRGFKFVFDVAGPLGKLGYVTPTWLGEDDVSALPACVQTAYAAGRTVLFLPLKRPGLVKAIQSEMDEFADQGRASLLFMKRLEVVELGRYDVSQGAAKAGPALSSDFEGMVLSKRLARSSSPGPEGQPPQQQVDGGSTTPDEATMCISIRSPGGVAAEHEYILHRHTVGEDDAELVLAFPSAPAADGAAASEAGESAAGEADSKAEGPTAAPRLEAVFCSLPVRSVGFGFAIHCGRFDLVANRADFHRGSPVNRAIRDALPSAFAAACGALPKVAVRAVALLGQPVADPFWRPARDGILDTMAGINCVTTAVGTRKPSEVLLRGSGLLRDVANLVPPELLFHSCSRAFADTKDIMEERLLKRLGAEVFSFKHLCQCLGCEEEPWPQGWLSKVWRDAPQSVAVATTRTIYRCLAAGMRDRSADFASGSAAGSLPSMELDDALVLPKLPLFPTSSQQQWCAKLEDGAIFRSYCPQLAQAPQKLFAESSGFRVLHPAVVEVLDKESTKWLDALQIASASVSHVVEIALEAHLKRPIDLQKELWSRTGEQPSSCGGYGSYMWATLDILGEVWLRSTPYGDLGSILEDALAKLLAVSGKASSGAAAAADLPGQTQTARCGREARRVSLAEVLLLPGADGSLRGPRKLVCPTFFGLEGGLTADIVCRIEAFLGLTSPQDALQMRRPKPHMLGRASALAADLCYLEARPPYAGSLGPLAWEAFLVDGLGLHPTRPLDPRQPRLMPDLCLMIGNYLGNDRADGFWRTLLNATKTPPRVLKYVKSRVQHDADAAWLNMLPVRTLGGDALSLKNLFLRSAYHSLAGISLEGTYLDLPEVASDGRGKEVRDLLQALGVQCEVTVAGVAFAVQVLTGQGCRDTGAFARLYSAAAGFDEDSDGSQERILSEYIFHPDFARPLRAYECIWAPPADQVLAGCNTLVPLRETYAQFGEKRLERYFKARGVPTGLSTAKGYTAALKGLLSAAEDLGKKWLVSPTPQAMTVKLSISQEKGKTMLADEFLSKLWPAVISLYKGMAALSEDEKKALRPFSPAEALVVMPLRCPHGGPPGEDDMLAVACFHNGACFRRVPVGEAFWEVAPDLAHARAAEWALASMFPADLRSLFIDVLGVREAVDRRTLREGLMRRVVPRGRHRDSRSPSRMRRLGLGPVNESGLPDDLLGICDEDFVFGGGRQTDVLSAAADAMSILRGRYGRSGDSSGASGNGTLMSKALPARSVRCPATRARKLIPVGRLPVPGSGEMAVFLAVDGAADAEQALEGGLSGVISRSHVRRSELETFAALLAKLAGEVFRAPGDRVAVILESKHDEGWGDGCGNQEGSAAWPLLFAARLFREVGQDAAFWFGEFCHALGHRVEGPEHCTRHLRVTQALMSKYLPAFGLAFGGGSGSALSSVAHSSRRPPASRSPSRKRRRRRSTSSDSSRSRERRRRR
eukprot:TRINITY_DN33156_c0_g1_i2.p1 TRINITY_DN33156_c0_g1~~TRINITY_DN33156_c0_g1_i2.p1  ORF type:complete len:2171 (-),score=491.00 TRINITY_DN33156_c0_g1_i2:138-6650(-)